MPTADVLTLAELEQFDPHASRHGQERRFCCPLPACTGKHKDMSHRCLAVNVQTGAYHCHRCDASGRLREFWEEKPQERPLTQQQRTRKRLAHVCALPPASPEPAPPVSKSVTEHWQANKRALQPLAETPGVRYLAGRGIPLDVAQAANVRYSSGFYGRAAVVFPIRDAEGTLTAMNGRYVDGDYNANGEKRLTGRSCNRFEDGLKQGVFATSGAWNAPAIVITEAPIDALSLHTAGAPTLALCGTALRPWMVRWLAWKTVYLAFDNDPVNTQGKRPGEEAFAIWNRALEQEGAQTRRLCPEGVKDWNQMLKEQGEKALRRFLATQLPYAVS